MPVLGYKRFGMVYERMPNHFKCTPRQWQWRSNERHNTMPMYHPRFCDYDEKNRKRMSNIFSKPLDAFKVHWIVPFTLAMIFALRVMQIICAFWDVYVGRRFKMGARGL